MYAAVVMYDRSLRGYRASAPDFNDSVLEFGSTEQEAVERFRKALIAHLTRLAERGESVPEPRYTIASVDTASLNDLAPSDEVVFHNPTTGSTWAVDADDDAEMPAPVWKRMQARLGFPS